MVHRGRSETHRTDKLVWQKLEAYRGRNEPQKPQSNQEQVLWQTEEVE